MTTAFLQAITFDLDDTLWDNHGVMERTETGHYAWLDAALADWLGQRGEAPAARFAERFPLAAYQARRLDLARRYPLRRGDFSWLRERALAALLEGYGLPRSAALLWAARAMQRFMALRHEVSPHPEVEPMLEALGRRYRLASITNGNVDVRRLALHRHFPVAIAAGEMFAPKPDARPFLAALARLDTAPALALHVGDSWKEDVLPARRLGMQAVWIAGADVGLPTGVHRLAHIRELPELIEWLEKRR
ncbi:HAD family hydrolase [Halomonas sp. LBP4]|uniref:HAD family hydrolase n=1 Tax=Halomonas sp. LBP4 TaxID=2044917 RepID=UPI000D755758|nr:HAD family hydrolase [Halomonas sp. LBP4]PXX96726.1 haloacid dehalogenase [Halomonas sp. LBP4]